MFTGIRDDDVFGFVRPTVDAHTLGISYLVQILKDTGYACVIADKSITNTLNRIQSSDNRIIFKRWLEIHRISLLGISYRLDPSQALEVFSRTYYQLEEMEVVGERGKVRHLFFAGLPESCYAIKEEFGERVTVFIGDETPYETLSALGVPKVRIPASITAGSKYEKIRMHLSEELLNQSLHSEIQPEIRNCYAEFGTSKDSVVKRIAASQSKGQSAIMRAHVGPYMPDRREALRQFQQWMRELSHTGLLDIASIGSSQLTQEAFGQEWGSRPNGGGVPINSAEEYEQIRLAALPMLMRTYAGTHQVPLLAKIHENSLNIAWHALSFWWFSEIDGRGPNSVRENLQQHLETLEYIALTNKPFEPNIPHHFAFRGGDDISYVLSALLAAKAAKVRGVRYLVLQIMLNTPKQTSGNQDLAKARALVMLTRELEDANFRIFIQPRAGLDYFSPNLLKAKKQLAAVSMMMTDIEPWRESGPDIIHVVSYSEGSFLATPSVINESIQITRGAIELYKNRKSEIRNELKDHTKDVEWRTRLLVADVRKMLHAIEKSIPHTYSVDGLYEVLRSGYLVAPALWQGREEFAHACNWKTNIVEGGCSVVGENGNIISVEERIAICLANIAKTPK
jgi:hypothetical protein